MRRYILILILLTTLMGSLVQADEVKELYKKLISLSMFTSNNDILNSGWYKEDSRYGNSIDLTNSNFVGSHYFGSDSDRVRAFVVGGFGFSKVELDSVNLYRSSSSIDDVELKSIYAKAGAGLNYNPTNKLSLNGGFLATLFKTDGGNYSAKVPLNMANSKDREIQRVLNRDSNSRVYDIFVGVKYHPLILGYHSYFIANLHNLHFEYDNDVANFNGYNADLKAGFHTHTLAHLANLPLWAEFFVASNLLDSDLGDLVGFDNAFSAGSSIHWKVGQKFPNLFNGILKDVDINLNLQATKSNRSFDGWKASVGVGVVRF